jgi:hypothetical protein
VRYGIRNAGRHPTHLVCLLPQATVDAVFVAPLKPLHIRVLAHEDAPAKPLAS